MVGDKGVGKTSLLLTYSTGAFPVDNIPNTCDPFAASVTVSCSKWICSLPLHCPRWMNSPVFLSVSGSVKMICNPTSMAVHGDNRKLWGQLDYRSGLHWQPDFYFRMSAWSVSPSQTPPVWRMWSPSGSQKWTFTGLKLPFYSLGPSLTWEKIPQNLNVWRRKDWHLSMRNR